MTGGSFASYLGPVIGPQPLSFGTESGAGYAAFGETIRYYTGSSSSLRSLRLTTALP